MTSSEIQTWTDVRISHVTVPKR